MHGSQARRAQLTQLIGRSEEVRAVHERLRLSRFVSITGPGGIGKTRIAFAVADDLDAPVVDLSSTNDAVLIPSEIAATLGLPADPSMTSEERVARALVGEACVIVLDNLETVDDPAVALQSLLGSAPGLRLIATSRAPVGIPGEAELVVEPLATSGDLTLEALEASPAGRLLLERARAIGAPVELEPPDVAWLSRLCRRLDGIPLALELAASQLRLMTAEEVVRGIEAGTANLVDRSRPSRHRSLDATVAWSLDQLDDEQFRVLAASSVAANGFDIHLVQTMAAPADAASGLGALMSYGLVRALRDEHSRRFAVLETIRAAVLERIPQSERMELEGRRAAAMLGIARRSGANLEGSGTSDPTQLQSHREDLRQALGWGLANDPDLAAEIATRLGSYWFETGALEEAMSWLDAVLATATSSDAWRVHALATRLHMLRFSDRTNIVAEAERVIAAARDSGDDGASVRAWAVAALTMATVGHNSAVETLNEALHRADATGLHAWAARLELNLAHVLDGSEEPVRTEERVRSAAARAALAHDELTEAIVLGNLAVYLAQTSKLAEAEATARKALSLLGERYPAHQAWILVNLAETVAVSGGPGLGEADFRRAIELALENPARHLLILVLGTSPVVLAHLGHSELAIRAMALARLLDPDLAAERVSGEYGQYEDLRRRLALEVGEVRAAVLEQEAAGGDPETLLRDIVAALDKALDVTDGARRSPRLRHGELTRREVEILRLLGEGRSDAEIAKALFITASTASVHVSNVKAKLGLKTRVEVALRARELGV